ncbi:DUF5926 family protein [Pseudactinotalea sp. HY158]|uniref:DUF5926 family protein n=1 Tax=Pseudactinotalea sp. HY158 TaxID=2654547 RepID=UPI001E5719ED|nr:DUF5926 family protein [Pseudactinotalea sp. HY158]
MAKRSKKSAPNEKVAARRAARKAAVAAPSRPFEGLPGEVDWVALREVVPAASARVRTTAAYGGQDVTIVTLLPMIWPAMKREDGEVLVALQVVTSSQDPSRDAAAALIAALDLDPGESLHLPGLPGPGPRLQDVLELDRPFEVTVHDDFGYATTEASDPQVKAALEESAGSIVPTVKVAGVDGAYWCRMGEREFLRWARPEPEEALLDGLARLHARRESAVSDAARLIGTFRSNGIVMPVWELAQGTEADELDLGAFEPRLADAVAVTDPLDADERRARAGLVSRQVTLR